MSSETAIDRARPGLRKNDLVAEIYHAGIAGVGRHLGRLPGDRAADALGARRHRGASHLERRADARRGGDLLRALGLLSPLPRAAVPHGLPRQAAAGDAATPSRPRSTGIEAGLEAARAGNRTCDIANAFIGVLQKHGIDREGRCGYPIGLSYPPDWGERTASIRAEDDHRAANRA